MKKNIVIIGGGTAGIISGLCLVNDFNVTIIDNSSEPGGLLRSENFNGIDSLSYFANDQMVDSIEPAKVYIEILAVNDVPVCNIPKSW